MLPKSYYDLFEKMDANYSFECQDFSMDNIESMKWFIEYLELDIQPPNVINFGTECFINSDDFNYALRLTSYGLGDEFTHGYSVEVMSTAEFRAIEIDVSGKK